MRGSLGAEASAELPHLVELPEAPREVEDKKKHSIITHSM